MTYKLKMFSIIQYTLNSDFPIYILYENWVGSLQKNISFQIFRFKNISLKALKRQIVNMYVRHYRNTLMT